jgi:hypothetical protein
VDGVAVVTVAVDSVNEIVGEPPELEPDDVTENPTEPVASTPATVACATTVSAPLDVALAGVSSVVTVPVESLNAELGLNAPRPLPAVPNFTTWPPMGAPVASRTTPVTVTGAVAVTEVEDKLSVIDGAPVVMVELLGVTWKPIVPDTVVPLIDTFATTRSAPLELDEAGESCTTAWPLAFVRAELTLNAPSPPAVEKVTT